jgi:hypothetical protein
LNEVGLQQSICRLQLRPTVGFCQAMQVLSDSVWDLYGFRTESVQDEDFMVSTAPMLSCNVCQVPATTRRWNKRFVFFHYDRPPKQLYWKCQSIIRIPKQSETTFID